MNDARREELWSRFLAGERLTPKEEGELRQALAADPKLRAEFLSDAEDHGMLRAEGRSAQDALAFDRGLQSRIEAEGDVTRFVKRVESDLAREDPPPEDTPRTLARLSGGHSRPVRPPTRRTNASSSDPEGAWRGAAMAAAGLLAGVALLFALSSSEPEPGRSERAAREAKSRETRAAEARRQAERDDLARKAAEADAERRRRDAEARLLEVERKQRELEAPPARSPKDPAAEEQRKKSLQEVEREKEQIERELREAAELAGRAERPAPAAPLPDDPRAPAAGSPVPAQGSTQVALALVEEVAGEAFRQTREGRVPLVPGSSLFWGEGVVTGAASRAVLRFMDKTRIELGSDTVISDLKSRSGKRMALSQGIFRAVVAKQPQDEPMIVSTPQAEIKVLGTTLRVIVDLDPKKGTRLEVEEGKVEFRNLAKKAVLVESGYYAVVAEGAELVAKALPIDEILLSGRQARLVGTEWGLSKDSSLPGGSVLFCPETSYRIRNVKGTSNYGSVRNQPSFALFSFQADGGKDYKVWVHGKSLQDPSHVVCAEIGVELPDAQLTPPDDSAIFTAEHLEQFNGFFRAKGYNWIGGNEEHPEGRKPSDVPLTIRFPRTGLQTLKVYVLQAPAWIDAIWISATQTTRPDDSVTGPAGR